MNCVGNHVVLKTKQDFDEAFKKKSSRRPIYLGLLIYAYARQHVYDTVLSKHKPIYTDTDSALLYEEEY
jgi:hypothetical protein